MVTLAGYSISRIFIKENKKENEPNLVSVKNKNVLQKVFCSRSRQYQK